MSIQHAALISVQCHEPKHISNASQSDSGKIITPSSVSFGKSVLRYIVPADIKTGAVPAGRPIVTSGAGDLVIGTSAESVYGGLSLSDSNTAVVVTSAGPDVTTLANYVPVAFPATTMPLSLMTQSGNNLELSVDGVYSINYSLSVKSDTACDLAAALSIDGVATAQGKSVVSVNVLGDIATVSGTIISLLNSSQTVGLSLGVSADASITPTHAQFRVNLLRAS